MNSLKNSILILIPIILIIGVNYVFASESATDNPAPLKKEDSVNQETKPVIPQKTKTKPVISYDYSKIQTALPEATTRIELSSTQINRIIAPSGKTIKDVVIQKGQLQVKIAGKNAFIGFPKTYDALTQDTKAAGDPAEIYAVVDDTVYTLVAFPKKVSAQTIQLGGDTSNIDKNIELFDGMPLEKKAVVLIQAALSNEVPQSFAQQKINRRIFAGIGPFNITLNRSITVEGENLILKEFYISMVGEESSINLNENIFLHPDLTSKPIGITLEDNTLIKGRIVRLFIVEKKG